MTMPSFVTAARMGLLSSTGLSAMVARESARCAEPAACSLRPGYLLLPHHPPMT